MKEIYTQEFLYPQDEAVINSYLPEPHPDGTPIEPEELPTSLPAYLINVKPELRIDGAVAATGTAVGLGTTETFTMQFYDPACSESPIINNIDAGSYLAIGLNLGRIAKDQVDALKTKLEATKAKLEAEDYTDLTKEDLLGDLFYTTALMYHAELDVVNFIAAKTMGVGVNTLPSETIFSSQLKVDTFFGVPRSVSAAGLAMDADRLLYVVKALDGDNNKAVQFMLNSGMNSSALEHEVPEKLFSTLEDPAEGISAVKALKIANDQGIPIYTINQSNMATVLPQLQINPLAKTDIENAVNAGKVVTVSKKNIDFHGWIGCGYIIVNPDTGAGAYMISGGLNGSTIIIAIITIILLTILLAIVAQGGAPFIYGVMFIGGGTVMETILASSILLLTKLFFIFYLTNNDLKEWIRSRCNNISSFVSEAVGSIVGQQHPLSVLTSLLGQLCD